MLILDLNIRTLLQMMLVLNVMESQLEKKLNHIALNAILGLVVLVGYLVIKW